MRSVLQVLQKNPFDTIGGVESVSLGFDKAFESLGIEAGYLFVGDSVSVHGRRVFTLRHMFSALSCDFGYCSPFALGRFVRSFDDILVHHPSPFLLLVLALTGVRFDVYYHSDIVRQRLTGALIFPLIVACLARSRWVFVSSPNYPQRSLTLGLFRKKIRLLVPSADEGLLTVTPDEEIMSRIPRPYFLFLGADRSYKSLDAVRRAAELANDGGYMYVLAGPGTERYEGPNLLGLGQVGVESKAALLRGCLGVVLVSTSRAEALGVCLIEGLMFGKPLITTNIDSGPSFVNIDGVTGYMVASGDPLALLAASSFIQRDQRKIFRENCLHRYRELFSFDSFVKKVDLVYGARDE